MPVFDWARTELARKREDGSTVLAYTQEAVDAINPEQMFKSIAGDMNGTVMPGFIELIRRYYAAKEML